MAERLLGAHMPVSGGLHKAVERVESLGGTALQLFTRNQRQWKVPPLDPDTVEQFRAARHEWSDRPVAAHDSYLTNLAAPDESIRDKSVAAFAAELCRCQMLGIPYLVTHPGAPKDDGKAVGLRRYASCLDDALERSETSHVQVLLENTAGAGSVLGSTLEELAEVVSLSKHPERIGVCWDTCHAHAAGHDLTTDESYAAVFDRFDALLGLARLRFFHLNDSKHPLGSHKDRHEHIGQGALGESPFARILADDRFFATPMVIETPKSKDLREDAENLARLRALDVLGQSRKLD